VVAGLAHMGHCRELGDGRESWTTSDCRKGVHDMKRTAPSIAVGLIVACTSVVLASTASAAGGELAGTWTSIDTDGSHQTLEIMGSGNRAYSMIYVDDSATGACGGNPARISGPGYVDGDDLFMSGALVCLPGGNVFRERIGIGFHYDAGSDTFTDDFGIVWHRTD
jgi:Flp pilus assembly pilin Flp